MPCCVFPVLICKICTQNGRKCYQSKMSDGVVTKLTSNKLQILKLRRQVI